MNDTQKHVLTQPSLKVMMAESTCFPGNTIHQGKENGKSDKGGNPKRQSLLRNKH